jgi:hypothetical protein
MYKQNGDMIARWVLEDILVFTEKILMGREEKFVDRISATDPDRNPHSMHPLDPDPPT